jgi:hypothetical protein
MDPENEAFALGFSSHFNLINHQMYRTGTSSLIVLEESLNSFFWAFGFLEYMPYFDQFYNFTLRAVECGIYHRLFENLFKTQKKKPEDIGPQILTLEHLAIGFYACLIPLALACISFICELLSIPVKRLFGELKRKLIKSLEDRLSSDASRPG